MIEPKELRILNIIGRKYFNPNPKNPKEEIEPCYVLGLLDKVRISLDLKGRDVLKCDYDLLEPIQLTPEILEKCGFIFINDTFYTKDNIVSFAVFNNNLSTTYVCGDNQINKTEYLHQLQNLYYSLVGSELNVVW